MRVGVALVGIAIGLTFGAPLRLASGTTDSPVPATNAKTSLQTSAAYTGSRACQTCHSAVYDAWSATRHAQFSFGCEACHGPGSAHRAAPSSATISVDRSPELCGRCHSRTNGRIIEASGGLLKAGQQYNEWRASPHFGVTRCTTCHDPHYSPAQDRQYAIQKSCEACHPGTRVSLGMQRVACERCHMPKADCREASHGVGSYRSGDRATHIWRIKPEAAPGELFSLSGTRVQQDGKGAFLTLNFACLGCHDGRDARLYDFESVRQTAPLVH